MKRFVVVVMLFLMALSSVSVVADVKLGSKYTKQPSSEGSTSDGKTTGSTPAETQNYWIVWNGPDSWQTLQGSESEVDAWRKSAEHKYDNVKQISKSTWDYTQQFPNSLFILTEQLQFSTGILTYKQTASGYELLINNQLWKGEISGFSISGDGKLQYYNQPVEYVTEGKNKGMLKVVGQEIYYEQTIGYAVRVNKDGTRDVLRKDGTVLEKLDSDKWNWLTSWDSASAIPISIIIDSGLSLKDVKPTIIEGIEGIVYYYEADFGDDVIMYFDKDGKQVREEGDFERSNAAWKPEEKNVYNLDGTLAERTLYGKDGKIEAKYTYGKDTLTIEKTDKEGTTIDTFWVARDNEGKIIGYELGTYNGKKVYYDPVTGDYKYADGSKISDEDKKAVKADEEALRRKKKIDDAESEIRDAEPGRWELAWRQGKVLGILKEFFAAYETFRGLGAYGALFWDEEELYERRQRVKEAFCKTIVFGDLECTIDRRCERYTDRNTGSNTLIKVVPGQAVRAVAHIEAERTETTQFQNETGTFGLWLYRVTFFASSPKEDNSVQLRFYYDGGTYDWFPEPQPIEAGGVVSASGSAAIVSYGRRYYTRVCLMLSDSIDVGRGSRVREICAPVVDSGLSPSDAEVLGEQTGSEQPGSGF